LAKTTIFAILMLAICGRGAIRQDVAMPWLRFIAVTLVAGGFAVQPGARAFAEPLDKDSCRRLNGERAKLLTPQMKAALARGPDWVKEHLDPGDIEKVRHFLSVEAMIEFRCRGGGVDKPVPVIVPLPDRKPDLPPSDVATADPVMPLPDRKPNSGPSETADESSQTVAGSVKTAPEKTKATQ
jgi:hypothetical protein